MEICNQETAYHALVYGLCHSTPQNGTYLTAARAVSAAKTALSTWQNAMLCNQLYVLSLAKATPAVAFNIKMLMAARALRLPQCMRAEAKQACCLIPTATALRRQRPRLRAEKRAVPRQLHNAWHGLLSAATHGGPLGTKSNGGKSPTNTSTAA